MAHVVVGAIAQMDCGTDVANRGWLTNGPDRGTHPSGLFGPVGLHGQHEMLSESPNSVVSVTVSEVLASDDNGTMIQNAGSELYNPFKVGGNGDLIATEYYPGRKYRISVTCSKVCALLSSVESGSREDSMNAESTADRAAFQLGTLDTSSDTRLKEYMGVYDYTSVANDMSGDLSLSTAYSYFWTAPSFSELNYTTLSLRTTVVVDDDSVTSATGEQTCEGAFYEYALQSLVKCGDGIKDILEECDDGNTNNGDGCSSFCQIEVGYTCNDLVEVVGAPAEAEYFTSVCKEALVIVTPTQLDITEGNTGTYSVYLSTTVEEGKEVFVSMLGIDASVQFSKTSLRFDSVNAMVAQPIIVTPVQNSFRDEGTRSVTIGHILSTSDANYEGKTVSDLTVNILDDDVADLVFSTQELSVVENGESVSYSIGVTSKPFGIITISLLASQDGQIIINPPTVVISPQDWETPQNVSIIAIDNNAVEGQVDVKIRHSISAPSDSAYAQLHADENDYLTTDAVTVHVVDNDVPGLTVQPTAVAIMEGTVGTTYEVSLQSSMLDDKKVQVALTVVCQSTDDSGNTVHDTDCGVHAQSTPQNQTVLTFDTTNWNQKQIVHVYAEDNDVYEGPDAKTAFVQHVVTSDDPAYANLNATATLYPYPVEVTLSDDDMSGFSFEESITLMEGGVAHYFGITMLSKPTIDVQVVFYLEDEGDNVVDVLSSTDARSSNTFDTQAFGYPHRPGYTIVGILDWTPEEWSQTKYIPFQANYDDLTQNTKRTTFFELASHSLDPNYSTDTMMARKVYINVNDNDNAGLFVQYDGAYGMDLVEGGDPESFSISLTSGPRSAVTVTLTPSSQLEVSPATLTFSTNNWSTPQAVQVTAKDDTLVEPATHQGVIQFGLASSDAFYENLSHPDLIVNIQENDFSSKTATVGSWGTVLSPTSPDGAATLNIPSGVLDAEIEITMGEIEKPLGDELGATETLANSSSEFRSASGTYSFEPHGTQFALPVYITLEYSEAAYNSYASQSAFGRTHLVFLRKANLTADWEVVPGGRFNGGIATIAVTSFSLYKVSAERLTDGEGEDVEEPEGLDAPDIAKCINGFELVVVDGQPAFEFTTPATNNETTCEIKIDGDDKNEDLLLIMYIVCGAEGFLLIVALLALLARSKRKNRTAPADQPSNALVPIDQPQTTGALTPTKGDVP